MLRASERIAGAGTKHARTAPAMASALRAYTPAERTQAASERNSLEGR